MCSKAIFVPVSRSTQLPFSSLFFSIKIGPYCGCETIWIQPSLKPDERAARSLHSPCFRRHQINVYVCWSKQSAAFLHENSVVRKHWKDVSTICLMNAQSACFTVQRFQRQRSAHLSRLCFTCELLTRQGVISATEPWTHRALLQSWIGLASIHWELEDIRSTNLTRKTDFCQKWRSIWHQRGKTTVSQAGSKLGFSTFIRCPSHSEPHLVCPTGRLALKALEIGTQLHCHQYEPSTAQLWC